jgi:hypothetical protein
MSENENAWKELCVSDELVEHKVKVGEKEFAFKLKPLSWPKLEELRSNHIIINQRTGITKFKEDEYELEILNIVVVEGPFEPADKRKFIGALKLDVKDSILLRIKKMHELDNETTKNSI